jgi:hypothetical protein
VCVPQQEREKERESLTEMINEQKRSVEWSVERDHPCRIGAEQELETKPVEDGTPACVKSRLSLIQQWDSYPFMDGSAEPNGQEPVTPSGHSSLFSDSMRPSSRERYTHGRTKSPSQIATPPANTLGARAQIPSGHMVNTL